MKIGWLVGQPAIFHPWFSSGSTVLSRRIQEPLHNYKLLEKMSFIHIIESGILVLSDIRDFYQLTDFFFFGRPVNVKWEYFRWSPVTAIDITMNYFYCIIIVSQLSSLFVLRSEGDWCVLALNIANVGLGFMEIMQLTCVASWLSGFLYIQVLLGIFRWIVSLP